MVQYLIKFTLKILKHISPWYNKNRCTSWSVSPKT